VWSSTEYELDWPPELVRGELRALRHDPYRPGSSVEIALLLSEAFHTEVPAADYLKICGEGEWPGDPGPGRGWVDDLLAHIDELRPYAPRPYWTARRVRPVGAPVKTAGSAPHRFGQLIGQLRRDGYLSRDFPEPCIDEPEYTIGRDLNAELRARLGATSTAQLWPLQPSEWDTETLYSLIEIFHDLVTRPRRCWQHEYGECGAHFEDFDTEAGRRVYRSLVNRLLSDSGIDLRLAEAGDNVGRLVHVVDQARSDLLARGPDTPDTAVAARIDHAIAMFRRRDADTEDKRSAVVVLAGILEQRRTLIKDTALLTRKDEGALFEIANNFAIRHQNSTQQRDYDPAFLDWIFWWYLATVDLTNRILAR
jgi:hypothetical protein